jgi:hypothetical protein
MVVLFVVVGVTGCDVFNAPEPQGFSQPTPYDPIPPGTSATSDAGQDGGAPEVDMAATLAVIADAGYRGDAFVHAVRKPYPSSVAQGSNIDEWITAEAFDEYELVAPDESTPGVQLPQGTMIVRAVVDSDNEVSKLTVMFKGPPGYNGALDDWGYAVTDPSGAPLRDDAGVLFGRLSQCYSCHLPRSEEDFLFGVPSGDHPSN